MFFLTIREHPLIQLQSFRETAVLAVGFEGIEEPGTHSGQTACCEDLKMTRTR